MEAFSGGGLIQEGELINWCNIFVLKKQNKTLLIKQNIFQKVIYETILITQHVLINNQENLVRFNITVTLLIFIHHHFTRCRLCYIVVIRHKRVVFRIAYKIYLSSLQFKTSMTRLLFFKTMIVFVFSPINS